MILVPCFQVVAGHTYVASCDGLCFFCRPLCNICLISNVLLMDICFSPCSYLTLLCFFNFFAVFSYLVVVVIDYMFYVFSVTMA